MLVLVSSCKPIYVAHIIQIGREVYDILLVVDFHLDLKFVSYVLIILLKLMMLVMEITFLLRRPLLPHVWGIKLFNEFTTRIIQ